MSDAAVKVGLLGCGTISQFVHLPVLMRARSIQFTAICEAAPDLLHAMALNGRRRALHRLRGIFGKGRCRCGSNRRA